MVRKPREAEKVSWGFAVGVYTLARELEPGWIFGRYSPKFKRGHRFIPDL